MRNIAERQPSPKRPKSQGDQQEQALDPGHGSQGDRRAGGDKPAETDFRHRPPKPVNRQYEKQPEGRIAHRLWAPFDELGVNRVEQTGDQGHAVVELPSNPAPERQDNKAGDGDAPEHRGLFPIKPQTVQSREDDRIDVQGRLVECLAQLARLDALGAVDVEHAVGANAGQSPGHHRPRHETQHDQQQQQPMRRRQPKPLGPRIGKMVWIIGRRRLKAKKNVP